MSRVTLRDVAERAGVSTAAISQALNDRGSLRPETVSYTHLTLPTIYSV